MGSQSQSVAFEPWQGYQCGVCGCWVPNGNVHFCAGAPTIRPYRSAYSTGAAPATDPELLGILREIRDAITVLAAELMR